MGWFVFLLFIIVLWIIIKHFSSSKKSLPKNHVIPIEAVIKPEIKVTATLVSDRKPYRTGELTPAADINGWIINPGTSFPLTIYGVPKETVLGLKNELDMRFSDSGYYDRQRLLSIITSSNLKCKEVYDYINKYRPIMLSGVENSIKNYTNWEEMSQLDKDDLLTELRGKAISNLDVRPECNIDVLFSNESLDHTIDDALLKKYGFDVMSFYLSKKTKVYEIPADHYSRKEFEKLVSMGLAVRGEQIPISAIIETFTIKEMTSLVNDTNPPKFNRKSKCIEYLLSVPDIRERLKKQISMRSLFHLQPLPHEYSHIDLDKIQRSWAFAEELARLISSTYFATAYELNSWELNNDNITGWEVNVCDDCCPSCKKFQGKKYRNRPQTPFHIGCRCRAYPMFES